MNVDNRSFNFNAKLDQIDHIDNCLFKKYIYGLGLKKTSVHLFCFLGAGLNICLLFRFRFPSLV